MEVRTLSAPDTVMLEGPPETAPSAVQFLAPFCWFKLFVPLVFVFFAREREEGGRERDGGREEGE